MARGIRTERIYGRWLQLSAAAWVLIVIAITSSAGLATVLHPGLPGNPDLEARLAFIAGNRALWTGGFLLWLANALAVAFFLLSFVFAHEGDGRSGRFLLRVVLVFLTAGLVLDLAANCTHIGLEPEIARQALVDIAAGSSPGAAGHLFSAIDRLAMLLGIFGANSLEAASILLLSLGTRHFYSTWVWLAGILAGLAGMAVSASCLFGHPMALLWANVFYQPLGLVWLAGVAITARAAVEQAKGAGQEGM